MKKILSIILASIMLSNSVFARSYPLKQISLPKCRFTDFGELGDSCKMDMPRIENADYKKYMNNTIYRIFYSVLWSSTYTDGWDIGSGSHLGVDMATAKGTPVYSIGDGEVTIAGVKNGRGNAVVIKHNMNGKSVYSVYGHLDSINTTVGTKVKEGDLIGKVGHTGNSYGNHLHFQIDTNQTGFHPYYYNNCEGSISGIVNGGICIDLVGKNTVDPIYFIETNGKDFVNATTQAQITKVTEAIKNKETIKPAEVVSRQDFMKTDLDYFTYKYDIQINSKIEGSTLSPDETGVINFKLVNKANPKKIFDDILPTVVEMEYDKNIIWVSPTEMKFLDKGQRDIQVKGLKEGTTVLKIKMFNRIIKSYTIRVSKTTQTLEASNGYVVVAGSPIIGAENWAIAVIKDQNYNNIIKIPYNGTFTIKANANTMLCNPKITNTSQLSSMSNIKCPTNELVNSITFKYSDTLKGLMLFKVLPKKSGNIELLLYKDNQKIGSNFVRQIGEVQFLSNTDPYTKYVKSALQNLIARTFNGSNFGPEYNLKESDAVSWIKNAFPGANNMVGSATKYISRIEFMKLISDMTGLKGSLGKNYIDVESTGYSYANMLYDKGILFLDNFGKRFFQPDQKIQRKEACYILEKLKSK